MKVGLIQYAPVWENAEASAGKLARLLDAAGDADVLIFPEMSLTGFTMKPECYAEGEDGFGMRFFSDLARKRNAHVIAGLIEGHEGGAYNSLVLFDRNALTVARYRKIHPFSFAGEDNVYSAGKDPIVAKIEGKVFGFSICYDLRFPELYRLYALQGATVMVNIANWPERRIGHWLSLLKARAIENQCYMIGINRVGADPGNTYNGCSAIFDPMGNEVVCVEDKEGVVVAGLQQEYVEQVRRQMPVLRDIKLITDLGFREEG